MSEASLTLSADGVLSLVGVLDYRSGPALREQLQAQAMEPQFLDAASTRRRIEEETARYRALAHRVGIAPD